VLGVPFVIGNQGVDRVIELQLPEQEHMLLQQCAHNVWAKLDAFLRG
jgi:malate/lactate dehydrogenase